MIFMYFLKIRSELDSKFEKLAKKNKKQLEIILDKANDLRKSTSIQKFKSSDEPFKKSAYR